MYPCRLSSQARVIVFRLDQEPGELTTDEGIAFRLHAVEGFAPAANTRQVVGTNPWTLVDQSWTSGPDVHRVRICVIRDASENPDVRISGMAWVDDVNLLPQSAEHAEP